MIVFEEVRLDLEHALQVEGVLAEHRVERHAASLGLNDARVRVHGANPRLDAGEAFRIHKVDLVEQNEIGEGQLLGRFVALLKLRVQMPRVHHGNDSVKPGLLRHLGIDEEGLSDRRRIGEARGLDEDCVEPVGTLHQTAEDPDQIAPDGAADAAVVHLEHFLVGIHHEVVVYAGLAEFR